MRYSVIAKGLTLSQIEIEIRKVGGRDMRHAGLLEQIFCELDEQQARALLKVAGLMVKPLKDFRAHQVTTVLPPVETVDGVFYLLRSYFSPPLTGTGLT